MRLELADGATFLVGSQEPERLEATIAAATGRPPRLAGLVPADKECERHSREVDELCAGLRAVVTPFLGLHAARDNAGVAVGGDTTFDIDEKAETFLETYMAERLPTWAYYSEDRGLQGAADPELILIVDPIDGTRPAAAGLEAAMRQHRRRPAGRRPDHGRRRGRRRAGDQAAATCSRPRRAPASSMRRAADEAAIPFNPTPATDIEGLFWTLGFRGRPALVLAGVLEELIDRSQRRRVGVRHRLGDVLDHAHPHRPARRVRRHRAGDHRRPPRRPRPSSVASAWAACCATRPTTGRGATSICREAGMPIADADGSSLDGKPVLGSDASYQMACIAAGNDELQAALVEAVQRGIARYRFLGAPAARGNPFPIGG